jgi:hypothetical protein
MKNQGRFRNRDLSVDHELMLYKTSCRTATLIEQPLPAKHLTALTPAAWHQNCHVAQDPVESSRTGVVSKQEHP